MKTEELKRHVYGCNSTRNGYVGRQDGYLAQSGWADAEVAQHNGNLTLHTRVPNWIIIKDTMSEECQYDRSQIDHYCDQCSKRAVSEQGGV